MTYAHLRALFGALLPLSLGLAACKGDDDTATDSDAQDDSATNDDSAADDSATDDSATDDSGDTAPVGEPLSLTILHVNDHHSHLQSETLSFDVSGLSLGATADAAGTPLTEVSASYGGFPLLVSLLDQLSATRTNVLRLHAGDAITGTLYYSLFDGDADAAMMNIVCFDAFTLGNHEFDDGDDALASFLEQFSGAGCGTPALSANLSPHAASPLNELVEAATVLTVDGQRVGVIGLTIAQKTMASSSPDDGTVLTDELAAAQLQINTLRADGVNKIILLTHTTYDADLEYAEALSGVDVIVGGDSHTLLGAGLAELGFNVVADYPTERENADGEPVCVVQAWEYAHLLGELSVEFDAEGVVTSCGGSPRMPVDVGSISYSYTASDGSETELSLSTTDLTTVSAAMTAYPELVLVSPDAETEAALAAYDAEVLVLQETVVGVFADDLCLERFPGQGRSSLCAKADTYAHGSEIADVVSRAFLTVTPTADLCLQNAGGVRVDVAAGEFTIADGFTVLPFSNTLVTLELTGAQVVAALEDALSNALDAGGSTGSYPYAAGLRYSIDASQAKGARVSDVEVNPRFAGSWAPIDLSATYTVVTNSFIASGQDGYTTFGVVYDAGLFVDTYTEYAEGLLKYVELQTASGLSVTNRPVEEASTQVYIGRDGCDHSLRADCSSY
jgi:5'-nucleotidase